MQIEKNDKPITNALRLAACEVELESIKPTIEYLVEELAFYKQRLMMAESLLLRIANERISETGGIKDGAKTQQ